VEADEVDFRRCLEVQLPYLGPVSGFYTDWTPLTDRPGFFPEDIDASDPWQFRTCWCGEGSGTARAIPHRFPLPLSLPPPRSRRNSR
jgi:hypothetical protein